MKILDYDEILNKEDRRFLIEISRRMEEHFNKELFKVHINVNYSSPELMPKLYGFYFVFDLRD